MLPPAPSLTLMRAACAGLLRGGGAGLQRWRGAAQLPPLAPPEASAAGGLFGTYGWSRCHAARLAASSAPSAAAEETSTGGAAAAPARQAASSGAAGGSGEGPRVGEVAEAPEGANADGPAGAAAPGAAETPAGEPAGSSGAGAGSDSGGDDAYVELPGGSRVRLTTALSFVGGPSPSDDERMPVYRTLDAGGRNVPGAAVAHALDQGMATKMYTTMAVLQTMDTMFFDAQRQGRFSFYLTSQGEEATAVGAAAALQPDDVVFAQYREQGVLLWRGYSLQQFANQLFGNQHEPGKGRQMPIHYGSRELNFHTISSTLATQLPHAVGAAYAMKLQQARTVSVCFFGEGASSEGDAHAAFNFAATLGVPVVFVCRNNGYAISTPSNEQFRGDGVAARGPAYGMSAVRVDGNDARAVFNAVAEARRIAVDGCRPVLVEAMSYRSGHHSTSDDSSRYRTSQEMRSWRARDPVARFRAWLQAQGWWSDAREADVRRAARQEVLAAMDKAEGEPKPPLSAMFSDVYDAEEGLPWHLQEQYDDTRELLRECPELRPPGMPMPPAAEG